MPWSRTKIDLEIQNYRKTRSPTASSMKNKKKTARELIFQQPASGCGQGDDDDTSANC